MSDSSDTSETPESLRERWKSGIWKVALDAILAEAARTTRTISAEFLKSLNLPEFQGRLDFRGVTFYEPLDPPIGGHDKSHFRLAGSEYKDMDFSLADMNFYVGDTSITNCLFRESKLITLRIWKCTISQCDFSRAFMPWFSAGMGTQFVHSIFDHTIIRHHAEIYGYASFEYCSFLKLDWRMIHFRGCCFNDCVFTGHLQKSDAQRTFSQGVAAIRDFLKKLECKGYNVFVNCSFEKLTVTRFSIQGGALTLKDCIGFPTGTLPSKEGHTYLDYYSDNVKPKNSQ